MFKAAGFRCRKQWTPRGSCLLLWFHLHGTELELRNLPYRVERVDLESIELPPLVERKTVPAEETFVPHAHDALSEVPAMSAFGDDHIVRYTTSSHDEAAYLTADPGVIGEMVDHYAEKIEAAADEMALCKRDFQRGADTLCISYGITSRSTSVAVREARKAGRKVSSLVLQTLWPISESAIRESFDGIRRVVVPEMNLGQYRLEIERLAPPGVEVVGVNKMNTTLITPEEILEQGGLR